jgi:epoxyqueuosine reductase
MPYYIKEEKTNLSRYARSRDYHFFIKGFEKRLKAECGEDFFVFADTSPVDEVDLATRSGLGSFLKNGLLHNKKYGSFVFIGAIYSTREQSDEAFEGIERLEARESCIGCNACLRACPTGAIFDKSACVSFINQKKKITPEEEEIIRASGMAWGCDVCQEVCPLNRVAKETPIPFFKEKRIQALDERVLDALILDDTFSERAFAWRGEAVLRRNLEILKRNK